jgi:hypothetical protein
VNTGDTASLAIPGPQYIDKADAILVSMSRLVIDHTVEHT